MRRIREPLGTASRSHLRLCSADGLSWQRARVRCAARIYDVWVSSTLVHSTISRLACRLVQYDGHALGEVCMGDPESEGARAENWI